MFDSLRQTYCSLVGLLCYRDNNAWLCFDRCQTNLRSRRAYGNIGDVADSDYATIITANDRKGYKIGRSCVYVAFNYVFVAIFIDYTALSIVVDIDNALHKLIEGHVELLHAVWIEANLILLDIASNDRHL